MMFREELLALKDSYLTRLNLVFVMTREQQDSAYLNGRIDAHRVDQLVDHWLAGQDIRFWFACGPDAMPAVVEQALRARGVDRRRIRVEYFVNSATPPTTARLSLSPEHAGRVSEIIVIQDAVRRSFSMQHGAKSILEAGLAAGLDMPYSCKSGICSTCRTKLTSGEVEMDNAQALEDYEIARGYRLLCQCFPVSDRIELDYDASD